MATLLGALFSPAALVANASMQTGERFTGKAQACIAAPGVVVGTVTEFWSVPKALPLQDPHSTVTDARLVSAVPSVFVVGFVQLTWTFAAHAGAQASIKSAASVVRLTGIAP
ncbi:MAG: hypothetical protein ACP5P4_15785 [Steroidobacteraceae bacterium]